MRALFGQFAANSLTNITCPRALHPTGARCNRGVLRCSADWHGPLTLALKVLTSDFGWLRSLVAAMRRIVLACNDVAQDLVANHSRLSVLQSLEELEVLVLVSCVPRPPVTCDTTMAVCPPPRGLVGFGRTDPRRSWRPFARRSRWRVSPSLAHC